MMKSRVKNHENQLVEFAFNEKFIKELGYSVDEFVTLIFQEGIPQ